MQNHIGSFRDVWLEEFFLHSAPHKKIPPDIHTTLARKLDIINAPLPIWIYARHLVIDMKS